MSSQRKFMHPAAQAALKAAEKSANLSPVVTQTWGVAPESKGVHEEDGKYKDADGKPVIYSAAIDFSVIQHATRLSDKKKVVMDNDHIQWWLRHLSEHGFAAWYRRESQGFSSPHIHAVFAGVKMKPMLQKQVRDFLNDRTGLKSSKAETYFTAPPEVDAKIRALFEDAN